MLDDDLTSLTRDELAAEVRRLRGAIRAHRDSSGHDLCWHHPELWSLLPEPVDPQVAVPPWPQFLRGCVAYRESLDRELPAAPQHLAEFDAPQPIDITEPIFDAEPVVVSEPIVATEPILATEPIVGAESIVVADAGVVTEPDVVTEPSVGADAGVGARSIGGAHSIGRAEPVADTEPDVASGRDVGEPQPAAEPEPVSAHQQLRGKLLAAADEWLAHPAAGSTMDTPGVLRQAADLVDQLTDTGADELLAALEVDERVLLRPALMFGISPEQVIDVIRRNAEPR